MCGRFTASFEFREIKVPFNLRDFPAFERRYNIAPAQAVAVIVHEDGANRIKPMRWGLVPSWAPDPGIGARMINARAETLTEKPSFKRLVRQQRCLVPANGFYEWRREGSGRVPVWVHLKNKQPFHFAGLWDTWRDPEGEVLQTFTIITTVANKLLRPIHNRMPVIYDTPLARQWLDPRFAPDENTLGAVLAPFPSELMEAHDVSLLVNKPEYDRPECIQPAPDPQFRLI